MTADEFVALVGRRVSHITLTENLPGIAAHGLLRPVTLAHLANASAAALVLREDRLQLDLGAHSARLNNQVALRYGMKSADRFLDGHTMESWSQQLDGRIFFWSEREESSFEGSHDGRPTSKLHFDSLLFLKRLSPYIDLAPINTGAAHRKPAPRGDWIYVPVTNPATFFGEIA